MGKTGGIVLCGGRSTRMGKAKAWLPFAGELLLQRAVRVLREAIVDGPVVVVAASDQKLPPLPDEAQITRDEAEGRGPLQGLAAGLAALHGQADAVFVSSCDAPFLQPAFVCRMIELLGDAQICVPLTDGYHHPLAAVYRPEVLPVVRELLQSGRLRPAFLFDLVPTRVVGADELLDVDPTLASLRNVNTPEDYEQALREI